MDCRDSVGVDLDLTTKTRNRCDRIAATYDASEWPIERLLYAPWRKRLWARVKETEVLEASVSAVKNMPYYPHGADVKPIDLSERILSTARRRAKMLGLSVG